MKTFLMFVKKEFYHIFRDKRTLLILFGMPVVQVILFGFAITNEINDAQIVILDQAKDESSREITDKLVSSGYFLLDRNLQSADELEAVFKEGEVKMAVVFAPEFGEKFYTGKGAEIQLIADATDPNTANVLVSYANAIIRGWQAEKIGLAKLPLQIKTEFKMTFNPETKSVFLFVPGVITVILMLVSAMMTSIAVTIFLKMLGYFVVTVVVEKKNPTIVDRIQDDLLLFVC